MPFPKCSDMGRLVFRSITLVQLLRRRIAPTATLGQLAQPMVSRRLPVSLKKGSDQEGFAERTPEPLTPSKMTLLPSLIADPMLNCAPFLRPPPRTILPPPIVSSIALSALIAGAWSAPLSSSVAR